MASAEQYASHLHLAPDKQPCQHLITHYRPDALPAKVHTHTHTTVPAKALKAKWVLIYWSINTEFKLQWCRHNELPLVIHNLWQNTRSDNLRSNCSDSHHCSDVVYQMHLGSLRYPNLHSRRWGMQPLPPSVCLSLHTLI